MAGEAKRGDAAGSGQGVYGISVAARLAGMDPQSLRLYEKRGLLEPDRTPGGTRLYSADDIERLRRIGQLLTEGLNLAGIGMVMDLQDTNGRLTRANRALRSARAGGTGGDHSPVSGSTRR